MSLLSNVSIKVKLLSLTLIPVSIIALIALYVGLDLLQQKQQSRMAVTIVELASQLDNLAHQHAVERGLSAGFLGSGGRQGKDKVIQQRAKADEAEKALADFIRDNQNSLIENGINISPINEQLAKKASVRKKVDQLDANNNAFMYYSTLNKLALDEIYRLTTRFQDISLRNHSSDLLSLLRMKERAGQSRGMLNGIYAKKTTDSKKYAEVLFFIKEFDIELSKLEHSQNTTLTQKIQILKASDVFNKIASIEDSFQAQHENLATIEGPSSKEWFPLATTRIKNIKQMADELSTAIKKNAESQKATADTYLLIDTMGIFTLLVGILFLGLKTSKSISTRINAISNILQESTSHYDLTLKTDESGLDEISTISVGINRYINWLDTLINDIKEIAINLEQHSMSFTDKTIENMKSSEDQQAQTLMAASAMTEMSASITQVASSCQIAADLSLESLESGKLGNALAKDTSKNANELYQSISESETIIRDLLENSKSIGGILDTIRGIAEQTNLLALNAAIEAARAGEQGRGFAVVADEVRSLAQRTQESTEEIQRMISVLQTSADQASNKIQQTQQVSQQFMENLQSSSEKIEEVNNFTEQVYDHMTQISTAAEEQATVSNDVASSVERVSTGADLSLETAKYIYQGSQSINAIVTDLKERSSKFKTT